MAETPRKAHRAIARVAPAFHNLSMTACRLVAIIFAALLTSAVTAQEMTPRAYWPAPKGTQVLSLGLAYTDGDIIPDPSLPIVGFDSEITSAVIGFI